MVDSVPLNCLVGKAVTVAETVHDYVQLSFGPDTGLSIYNDFWIAPEARPRDLVGQRVIAVDSTINEALIRFEGSSLTVDLRPSAFHGPEAMQLHRDGHDPIIWS